VTYEVIVNWEAALGNWLWLCPLFAIGLAAGVLMFWRLSVWTAIVAALGFLNPIIAVAAMSFSSVSVVTNEFRLNRVRILEPGGAEIRGSRLRLNQEKNMTRFGKTAAALIAGMLMLFGAGLLISWGAEPTPITVYKSPTCGCCEAWIKHLRANGFEVIAKDVADPSEIKRRLGVPAALASCHTATIEGYVIEGHVPAATIRRLLRDRPSVAGLAVPGMPASAPGMDSPVAQPYAVLMFNSDGRSSVYERH
jgi:hypothetical protein